MTATESPWDCGDCGWKRAALDATAALVYLVERARMTVDLRSTTGRSSDAMVLAAFTGSRPYVTDYPLDRWDWRRCLLAYALAPPELRERMRPIMRAYRANLRPQYRRWLPGKTPALWMVFENRKAAAPDSEVQTL